MHHFEERCATIEGKGMIVAMSRDIYAHLYNAITAIRPEWHDTNVEKGALKVIMTASVADKLLLQEHNYNKVQKERLEKCFKDHVCFFLAFVCYYSEPRDRLAVVRRIGAGNSSVCCGRIVAI